jgi:uncharacterized protein YlxW (UPF0749 family)
MTAIGDTKRMQTALSSSPGVADFQEASRRFGLGYRVTVELTDVRLPAYRGTTTMKYAGTPSR